MKKFLKIIFQLLLVLLLVVGLFVFWNVKDRHSGYEVDLFQKPKKSNYLKAGFSALRISPRITDTWKDANGDAQYNPEDGDQFEDNNSNGKFDPVWMAGFQNRRPANGIHDDLWARCMMIDDGNFKLAVVALDLIGFGSDEVIAIRKKVAQLVKVDYTIVCSTHTHEGPDVLGMWGAEEYRSGVDEAYKEYVINQAAASVKEAVAKSRPAKIRFAKDEKGAANLAGDTRKPYVFDPTISILQAIDSETKETLGTFTCWSNHPETTWNKNLLISSDFPHFYREAMEKGVVRNDSLLMEGLGGTAVYVSGSIGGLITTHPDIGIRDQFDQQVYTEPSFKKARAQGEKLARLSLNALNNNASRSLVKGAIRLRAKTLHLPLDNNLFKLAASIGVLDRGMTGWMKVRSEICYWKLGPASFLHHPGEIYPEIIHGGVEHPEGQDFNIAPIEEPPIKMAVKSEYPFYVGLSNDMVGYIIPKSEWDEEPPFLYGESESPYGEINSLGPNTAPILHQELIKLIHQIEKK